MDVRLPFRFLILVPFALSAAIASASEIALTAFEPFGGVPVNNSAEVASRLGDLLRTPSATGGTVKVTECILPVEYDRAAEVALRCIGDRKPDLVLSFGAGDCEIHFETRGRNRDQTYSADNAGVIRDSGTPIVPGAPEYLTLSAPMISIYEHAPRLGAAGLAQSEDAGAYVCNNTAYHLAHTYRVPNSPTRYGFIHVPPTTCGAAVSDPVVIARTIELALREAMPELF